MTDGSRLSACARPRRGAGPAHVATRAAPSMRKSAGCMGGVDAGDLHALLLRGGAADDGDAAPRHMEYVGEDVNQLSVGRTVDWRRREPDEQGIGARPGNAGSGSTRNDSHSNDDPA